MNSFISIKTNWYTKVKKHLHVSKHVQWFIMYSAQFSCYSFKCSDK